MLRILIIIILHKKFKFFFRRYIFLFPKIPDRVDRFFKNLKVIKDLFITFLSCRHWLNHYTFAFLSLLKQLPYFFSNERHKGMKEFQECIKKRNCAVISFHINRPLISRFNSLKVPG